MKVLVIGGGAGGMMAAYLISKKGHDVTLIEKNEKLGKKIYITGKGRCNVTNATIGNAFLANVVNNPKFIMSSEVRFNSSDTMELFESLGVPLKVERGNRVFPVSDKASDITKALEKALNKNKVQVMLNTTVKNLITSDNKITGVKLFSGEAINADAVIVATGGISYKQTGSTGDGYVFAKETGHTIVEPVAALTSIITEDKDLHTLSGLSLKNVRLKAQIKNKDFYESEIGEMLITGNGISGPLALTLSSMINRQNPENVDIFIDFKPALDDFALFSRIGRDIVNLKSKQLSSLMEGLLPKNLAKVFIDRLALLPTKKASQLTSEEREMIVKNLKNFKLKFSGLDDIDRAVVTSGGVSTRSLKPKSMESKLIEKLYFVGEVVDVDALTGGFNMQLAFSMAAAAASDF